MTTPKTLAVKKPGVKKTVAKTAPATATTSTPPAKRAPAKAKPDRQKLVRDSFTIPKSEYVLIDALKLRAAKLDRPTKKSELLRAGIAALNLLDDSTLLEALSRVPSLKTGRPSSMSPKKGPSVES